MHLARRRKRRFRIYGVQYRMIAFIHIGKTGGTTINTLLKTIPQYHQNNNYKDNEKYIIWLRHPVSRFVSAFNHAYYGVHVDTSTIKTFDLNHCLIPWWIKNSIGKEYVFSKQYDALVKQFSSPNHLAESLSSENKELRENANLLMCHNNEHINKGIGWYLKNGKFIKDRHKDILFVGTQENMQEDIIRLSKLLNVKMNPVFKIRENIYVDKKLKYLSPIAIKNIMNFYKNTDYAALKTLKDYNLITEEIYELYCKSPIVE